MDEIRPTWGFLTNVTHDAFDSILQSTKILVAKYHKIL